MTKRSNAKFVRSSSRVQAAIVRALYFVANSGLEIFRKILWPRARPVAARHVCVYRTGNIGDTVCAVPALYSIRRTYPDSTITLLTSPGSRSLPGADRLLGSTKWLDRIRIYYADEIDTLRKRWSLVKSLRLEKFDVWIELPNDPATLFVLMRNMLMAKMAGVSWGYGWRLSTIRWAVQAQTEHFDFPNEVQRLLGMLVEIGFRGEAVFPLEFDDSVTDEVQGVLRGIAARSAMVAVAPGAKRRPNKWPIERYEDVTRHLVANGFTVLLIGGEEDRAICEGIGSAIGPGVTNLAGRLSLLASCQIVKACDFIVCNDSGVQHLAAAVGTPCISLFSSRDFRGKWWPHGSNNAVIVKAVDCHTCLLESCPHDNYCMKQIQADEVKALIDSRSRVLVNSAS